MHSDISSLLEIKVLFYWIKTMYIHLIYWHNYIHTNTCPSSDFLKAKTFPRMNGNTEKVKRWLLKFIGYHKDITMLNSSRRKRTNEYTQIRTVPPQKPPAVISSSKTSENPLPAFNFDSRPSINWKKKVTLCWPFYFF